MIILFIFSVGAVYSHMHIVLYLMALAIYGTWEAIFDLKAATELRDVVQEITW